MLKSIARPMKMFMGAAVTVALATGGGLAFANMDRGATGQAHQVTVYKIPTCVCCGKWVEHMEEAGFEMKVEEMEDLAPVRERLGVPYEGMSCHTAEVGGLALEGHVPADLVLKTLEEGDESVKGLLVPGMPFGSPGMPENPNRPEYDIFLLGENGEMTPGYTR